MNMALNKLIEQGEPLVDFQWFKDYQNKQEKIFLQQGLPTRRQELWKYTDITFLEKKLFSKGLLSQDKQAVDIVKNARLKNTDSILMTFINGHFSEQLSDLHLLPANVVLCHLKQALVVYPELLKTHFLHEKNMAKQRSFTNLNSAMMTDGVFLSVPDQCTILAPIHFLFISLGQNEFVTCPRNLILAGENSQVTILEEYCSDDAIDYLTNVVTEIDAEKQAVVYYHKIQNESLKATHLAQIYINQKQNSIVKAFTLGIGSQLARDDIQVNLQAPGAESSANGFYHLHHDGQHIDNHVHIDHLSPLGMSDMVYKGILNKKSHAVFNGKIFVHPDAQKTQAHQANHHLLLSKESSVDAKPEFEIYADDVKCHHGNTVGQLDQESLFYLRSRGLEKNEAQKILAIAFAASVMERVTCPAILQRMNIIFNETIIHDN